MRSSFFAGFVTALLLAAFLVLRPMLAESTAEDVVVQPGPAAGLQKLPAVPLPSKPASWTDPGRRIEPWDDVAQNLLDRVNRARDERGAKPLEREASLEAVASDHSRDMLLREFYDHINPDGVDAASRAHRGCRTLVGRVLEMYGRSEGAEAAAVADKLFEDLVASPQNAAILTGPATSHIGIGVFKEEGQTRAVVEAAEVAAWLASPLPDKLVAGDSVDMRCVAFDDKPLPSAGMFWAPRQGQAVGAPAAPDQRAVTLPPGRYRLLYRFPASTGAAADDAWVECCGPEFEMTGT